MVRANHQMVCFPNKCRYRYWLLQLTAGKIHLQHFDVATILSHKYPDDDLATILCHKHTEDDFNSTFSTTTITWCLRILPDCWLACATALPCPSKSDHDHTELLIFVFLCKQYPWGITNNFISLASSYVSSWMYFYQFCLLMGNLKRFPASPSVTCHTFSNMQFTTYLIYRFSIINTSRCFQLHFKGNMWLCLFEFAISTFGKRPIHKDRWSFTPGHTEDIGSSYCSSLHYKRWLLFLCRVMQKWLVWESRQTCW